MPYPDAANIDATVNKAMDLAFVHEAGFFNQVVGLANKSAQQLSNLTDNIFLQMTQLYQAKSAQNLETSVLAKAILDQRSAMNQPQQAPSFNVPVTVDPSK